MKQRFNIIAVLLCLFTTTAIGQTYPYLPQKPDSLGWYHNLEKYWWYRYRLINDFLIVGPDCGMSIPAQRRETWNYWDNNSRVKLKWADATIDLGNYIAMLASEYKILKNNNLDCTQTLKELYYALNAFERLDNNAEIASFDIDDAYPCRNFDIPNGSKWVNMLNGFFIRDDVPYKDDNGYVSLVNANFDHFNRPGIKNLVPAYGIESSAFSDRYGITQAQWGHYDRRVPVEESQDQVVQMGLGLSLTASKLNGATYNNQNLGAKAAANLYRMIDHIANYWHNWDIINPVRSKCVYGLFPDKGCNKGGAETWDISRGAAIAMQRWTAQYGYFNNAIPTVTSTNNTLNYLWQLEQFVHHADDNGFWGTYAALSDSWIQKIGLCSGPVQICYTTNSTYNNVRAIAEANDWGNCHLPLVYRWLYGQSGVYRPTQYQMLLDAAPGCGIHNYQWNWSGHDIGYLKYWTGNDAIHEWYHRSDASGDNSDCNGLDYMNIYNLYIMEDPAYQQMYFNAYYKTNLTLRIPNAKWAIGTSTTKLTLNYLEYLSTIAKVDPGGYLTLRGAKVIDFNPGFDAKQGSVFSAYVQDYQVNCNTSPFEIGEAFHHALINGGPTTYALKGTGEGNADSSYYLNYPPDGEPFIPEEMPTPSDQDTSVVTCEMQHQYFDELVQQIYESGDSSLIQYMDSVIIPNATFSACDPADKGQLRTVNSVNANKTTQIYPNPNNGQFTVAVPEQDNYTITVYDMTGRTVREENLLSPNKNLTITAHMPPGNYVVSVRSVKYCVVQKITVIQ